MNRYTAIVTIATKDIDNAEQVLNWRVSEMTNLMTNESSMLKTASHR